MINFITNMVTIIIAIINSIITKISTTTALPTTYSTNITDKDIITTTFDTFILQLLLLLLQL